MNSLLNKEIINSKTFLTYKISDPDSIDQLSVEMLKNNEIPHILPVIFTQIGAEKQLKYDITSKISLFDVLQNPISKERLIAIYNGIFEAVLSLEDYMIPNESLLLEPNQIYFDEFNDYIYLICFPINIDDNSPIDLEMFTRSIANRVQLKVNDEYIIGKIFNKLNQTQTFSAVEFKKFINSLVHEKENSVKNSRAFDMSLNKTKSSENTFDDQSNNIEQKKEMQDVFRTQLNRGINLSDGNEKEMKIPGFSDANHSANHENSEKDSNIPQEDEPKMSLFYLLQHYNSENAAIYKRQKESNKSTHQKEKTKYKSSELNIPGSRQAQQQLTSFVPQNSAIEHRTANKRDFGDTTVLNGKASKKTTVLNAKSVPLMEKQFKAVIIREKNNERIAIDSIPFSIGASEEGDVNYSVSGNTNISRSHVIITFLNGFYSIKDDNSTNGTYVNGAKLLPQSETRLNKGDYIRMADEDFRFDIL